MADSTDDTMTNEDAPPEWGIYRGLNVTRDPNGPPLQFPEPPPWRRFPRSRSEDRGSTYRADRNTIEMVNAALYLRRPLLITGKPGSGKSTLPYAVALELGLDPVLRWNITSRTTLKDGLYHYDALARLHDYNTGRDRPVADYIDLGPLGTALLPSATPRVLLIDEIDKADIDLPNDLLNIFEEGYFDIPELVREESGKGVSLEGGTPLRVRVRSADGNPIEIAPGRINCTAFPFVVLTSNGERDFPPPFLRRCLRLYLGIPNEKLLAQIVDAHLPIDPNDRRAVDWKTERARMIIDFLGRAKRGDMATDQLLNALFMTVGKSAALDASGRPRDENKQDRQRLIDALLRYLTPVGEDLEPIDNGGASA